MTICNARKKICLKTPNTQEAKNIQEKFNLSSIFSNILATRGYKADEKLENFLNPTLKNGIPNPEGLKGLDETCNIIVEAILKKEKIAICSDFDVDGLTSSSQMKCFFDELNIEANIYVPDRFKEGYGLNKRMIDEAKEFGATLLLSLDYGTTNKDEILYAKSLQMKTVVIDHHHVGEQNPEADAFINPKQEGCSFQDYEMCTAGLVWYVIICLSKKLEKENIKIDYKKFLDLSVIGTICDLVPLTNVNRVIAKKGLQFLNETKRLGICVLKNVAGLSNKNIESYDISFNLGPRLNSAGRMASGEIVSELLTTKNENRAKRIAERLEKLNSKRQKIEEDVKKECINQVNRMDELPYGICAWHPDFHTGVVGIVAQRLVEKYYKPSVVLGLGEDNIFKGSVRGIEGFSVIDCLSSLSKYLLKFGGHQMAGGLSLKREMIKDFAFQFNEYCKKNLTEEILLPKIYPDVEVKLKDLNSNVIKEFSLLAPFGMANPAPQIYSKNLEVKKVIVLKNAHLKVLFLEKETNISMFGMLWRQTTHPYLKEGNVVNIVYKPTINFFGGVEELQANIGEVELSS